MCAVAIDVLGQQPALVWNDAIEYGFLLSLPYETHAESHTKGQVEQARLQEIRI